MKFFKYLKDKLLLIALYLLTVAFVSLLLNAFNTPILLIAVVSIIYVSVAFILLLINYLRKYKYYNNLIKNVELLDKKFLVMETIENPNTYEEEIMTNLLYDINKSMIENIKSLENNLSDYIEFVEMWIHEVKIPISSLMLKCHNNKTNKEFIEQIRKLDNYVDQVLYYVRSENAEKDFIITESNLSTIIKNVSLKNKDDLLDNKIDLEVTNVNTLINTDSKWLEFIINQIINNSIKYKKDKNSIIKIYTEKEDNKIIFNIYDNGIGICEKDIKNVFNKCFTGENGKSRVKSTGMGLYIAKKLCTKLGHNILIESNEKEFTNVKIIFNNNDFYNVTKK